VSSQKASRRIHTLEETLDELGGQVTQNEAEIQYFDDLITLFQNILRNDEYVKNSPDFQTLIRNVIASLKTLKEQEKKEITVEEEAEKILLWLLNNYKTNYGY
jgi:hypothetical protein